MESKLNDLCMRANYATEKAQSVTEILDFTANSLKDQQMKGIVRAIYTAAQDLALYMDDLETDMKNLSKSLSKA